MTCESPDFALIDKKFLGRNLCIPFRLFPQPFYIKVFSNFSKPYGKAKSPFDLTIIFTLEQHQAPDAPLFSEANH